MVAMAELLSVKIPSSYEVLFPDGPVRAAVVETKKVETDMAGERLLVPTVSLVSPGRVSCDGLSLCLAGVLGAKEKAALAGKVPDGSSEWLKQFDAVLPGYSLKGELDLLTLLRQVCGGPTALGPGGGGGPLGLSVSTGAHRVPVGSLSLQGGI